MTTTTTLGRFVRALRTPTRLESPPKVARYLARHVFSPFSAFLQEELWVLTFDARHRVTHTFMASRGTADASIATPSIVFREAIALNAGSLIVAHNHPSGDPEPSRADVLLTDRLLEAGKILDLQVLDHFIIGKGRWQSIVHDARGTTTSR